MFFRRPELFKALFFEMIIIPRQLILKNETPSLGPVYMEWGVGDPSLVRLVSFVFTL